MIHVELFTFTEGGAAGFRVSGHSDAAAAGSDIICAAVSSAAYMTANTITDIVGVHADITVKDGLMCLKIPPGDAGACGTLLEGFRLHITALGRQYPENIKITGTEV